MENLGGLKQEVGDDIRKISSTNWKRSQCCRGWHFSRRPAEAECLDSSVLSAQAHTPRQLHFFFPDDKSSSAGDKSCHCLRVHHGFNLTTTYTSRLDHNCPLPRDVFQKLFLQFESWKTRNKKKTTGKNISHVEFAINLINQTEIKCGG